MAGKPLNRLDLRRQREAAEPLDPMEDETDEVVEDADDEEVVETKPKIKAKAPAKSKAKSSRAAKPACEFWHCVGRAQRCVQAGGDFRLQSEGSGGRPGRGTDRQGQGDALRASARKKLRCREDAPGIGAAIPRVVTPAPKASRAKAAAVVEAPVEDEEEIEEEEDEVEVEEAEDDDE